MKAGLLYVVATPIGNRKDITLRALEVLGAVDRIAAEDTRHSRNLLSTFGINAPLISLHEHNEQRVTPRLLGMLKKGENIALVSDAGTPLISDPGYRLVQGAREAGITVVPVPGPSAVICALSVAGLPTDRFVFEGFLPAKRPARKQRLTALAGEHRTLVFYESSHRILEMLQDLAACLGGGRTAVLARELTKLFETICKGTLTELLEYLQADQMHQKGEFVILVSGADATVPQQASLETQRILEVLLRELPVKQAAALTAKITGEKRNAVYAMALALQAKD